jgi:hypothetical protein
MLDAYDEFLGIKPTQEASDPFDDFLNSTQDTTPEPEDLSNEEIAPSVQADIEAATPPIEEPNALDSSGISEGTKTGIKNKFHDIWESYSKRVTGASSAIDQNLTTPFKKDESAGSETLQKVGDTGAKVGSSAVSFLDTAIVAPIAAGVEQGIKPIIKPAANFFEKVIDDPRFKASRVTDEKVNEIAGDTADVLAMGLLAPKPMAKVGTVGKKSVADMLKKEQTRSQLQDMGYDVSNLGTEGAQQFTKTNAEVAEALGSVPKGTSQMLVEAEKKALNEVQQTALANISMAAQNPTKMALHEEQPSPARTSPLVNDIHKQIDADIARLEAEKAATKVVEGGDSELVNKIHSDIDKEIAVLKTEKSATRITEEPLNEIQFIQNIETPVASAVEAGVPINKIQDELVQSLLTANRKPEEIDDLVEAALSPYYEYKVGHEKLPEFKPTEIPKATAKPTFLGEPKGTASSQKLLTAEDVEKIVNSNEAKAVATFIDDFTFQNRFSREFSKKNNKVYGDLELNAKDTTLNKIASVREVNNNVFTSWIDGDVGGRVYEMTNGIQKINPDIKPLRKIYTEASEAGLDAEQAKTLHKAANANSNWQRIDTQIETANTKLQTLKADLAKASTDQARAILRAQIKTATKELNEAALKNTYMSREEVAKIMDGVGKTDAGQNFLNDMKSWTDGVLDMRVRAGRLSSEEAMAMKSANKNYLPELRDVEDYADFGIRISGTKDASKGIQGRDFSSKDLNVDPVESLVDYLGKTEHSALRTEERYHTLIHNLEHMDEGAFNVLFEQDKNKVIEALMEIKGGKFKDKIYDTKKLYKEIDTSKVQASPNFSVFVDGKRLDLTVKNTKYLEALTRPRLYQKQSLGERYVVNPLAHITRNSFTTWNPVFQPAATIRGMWGYRANMPKDLRGTRSAGTKMSFSSEIKKLVQDKEYYNYLKANISPGVLNRGLHGKTTEELISSTIQKINKPETKGLIAKPKQGVVYVKNNLEEWAEFNEMVVRGRAYEEAKATLLKQGMSPQNAELAAIRVAKNLETNYFSQGNSGSLYRFVQNGTPFLRTRINGAMKAINSAQYRPKQVAGGIAGYMAVLHATNIYNRQYLDKDGTPLVDKLDPTIRQNNFVIMLPGAQSVNDRVQLASPFNFIRLGNAAEMAFDKTMKSLAHKVYDSVEPGAQAAMEANPVAKQYLQEGKLTAQDVASITLDLTLKDFDPSAFTGLAGLGTLAELSTNRDSFGNDIVPSYMQDLPSYMQVNPTRANPSVIAVANALAERGIKGVNPTIVSYVVQDTLGGIGDMMLAGSDIAYSALSGKERPKSEFKYVPGVGRFTGLGSNVPNTGIEKQYSHTYKELAPVFKEYQKLKTAAETDSQFSGQFQKFYEDNIEAIMLYKEAYEPVQKELTEAYKELNRLQGISGETLPSESTPEKELLGDPKRREQIDAIRKDIQGLQASALDELYERRDVLGKTWGERLKVNVLADFFREPFLGDLDKEIPAAKPKTPFEQRSDLETYDDSNPPSMLEQSGMDLQTVDYQPTVYELFLEKGAATFDPKDIKMIIGSEEPRKDDFFEKNFPNIDKKFSKKEAVNNDFYATLAMVESSNNPNAKSKTSSATGLYQFTKDTWQGLVNKYGKSHGLTEKGITNASQQEKAIRLFTEDNKQALAKKLDVTPDKIDKTALYAAHFLGVHGAATILQAPYSTKAYKLLPQAAKANKTIFYKDKGTPRTVKEVLLILENKMSG